MMGTHHAITGAAAWVAVTSTAAQLPAFGWFPLEPAGVALGAIICAGAALLPDADHHNATIAHSLPGVGQAATALVGAASGGHRHGTHSGLSAVIVLALAIFLGGTELLGGPWGTPANVAAGVAAAALLAFSLKVLKVIRNWAFAWVAGAAIAALISWAAPEQWAWLPMCIAIGWIVHLAGDFLTVGGLPLLWPLNPKAPKAVQDMPVVSSLWSRGGYFALPVLGTTGSWREWLLMVPTGLYALAGIGLALLQLLPFVQLG